MNGLLALLLAAALPATAANTGRAPSRKGPAGPTLAAPATPGVSLAPAPLLAPTLSPSLAPSAVLAPKVDAPAAVVASPLAPKADAPAADAALPTAEAAAAFAAPQEGASGEQSALRAGAVFDQAKVPDPSETVDAASPAAGVFDTLWSREPALEAALESRMRGSAYAATGRDWKTDLRRAFTPLVRVRARQLGMSEAAYAAWYASPDGRVEREGLARLLGEHTGHRAEEWTYVFRDYPLWKEPLEKYLDGVIAERKSGKRSLDLQSVGAGYGSESYSLAIMVDQALKRAGEDPQKWRVSIRAYDISLMSLLTAAAGAFRLTERDKHTFGRLGLQDQFEEAPGGLLRLKAPLRDWIKPVYADVNDPRQRALVTEAPADVVFANYLLYHLRQEPAHDLANHWLSGKWSKHGFLSMAQVIVAEVGESRRERVPLEGRAFLSYHYGGNTGWAGRAFYADTYEARGGFKAAMRNMWRARRAAEKQAFALGGEFRGALGKDPFATTRVDPVLWDAVSELAQKVPVVLTDQRIVAELYEGKLYLNWGWVLEGGKAQERLAELKTLAAEELARGPASGSGVSVLSLDGARLSYEDGRLRWLTDRLVPLSIDFFSDNAAKRLDPVDPEKEELRRERASAPRGLRGFN